MMPRATPSTTCGWGVQRRCQVLLVQRTVQNNSNVKSETKYLACARISIMCFLLLNSFFCCFLGFYSGQTSLGFFSQSCQPSAAFSIRLCTRFRKIRKLQRASHAVLPFLCRQETSSRCCHVMHVSKILPGRGCKLTFLSVTNTYVRTNPSPLNAPAFYVTINCLRN